MDTTAENTTSSVLTALTVTANLTGASEAPQPGDVDGSGEAKIELDSAKGEVCFDIKVANIDKPNAAHIHKAPPGTAGNVVVTLAPPEAGTATGCTEVGDELVADIIANPDAYYVNVHNAAYEKGAVRGQLHK